MKLYSEMHGAEAEALEIDYECGWDRERGLEQVLTDNRSLDARYGATQNGPHRADLSFKIGRSKAVEILSRGQQKILVSAMKLAQGLLLSEALDRSCLFLVDDLPSELDQANRDGCVVAADWPGRAGVHYLRRNRRCLKLSSRGA